MKQLVIPPLALQLLLAPGSGGGSAGASGGMHKTQWASSGELEKQQQQQQLLQQQLAAANYSDGGLQRACSPSTSDSLLLQALPSTNFPTPSGGFAPAAQWGSAGPASSSAQQPQALQPSAANNAALERAVSSLAHELAALAAATNSPSGALGALVPSDVLVDNGQAASAKSLQPKLLKQINSLTTKEEILNYIQHCHHLLDSINLVTCLYRLARIYSFTQSAEQKAIWKAELMHHPAFTLLLSVVHGHLVRAHGLLVAHSEVPGLNARCMSNLVWSIVKLEVVGADVEGHPLALDVALASVPLVLCFIKECSGQGLANLLWSFVKIPSSPAQVITAIVERMVELLEQPSTSATLDAQALSNTIWAIAHIRSQACAALDNSPQWNNAVTSFLLLMANQCMLLLTSSVEGGGAGGPQQAQRRGMGMQGMGGGGGGGNGNQGTDGRFSCQAVVNIVWSFSTILGSACGVQAPMRPLFLIIRQLAVARLQAMLSSGAAHQPLALGLTGNFNEQALSNLVFAFNKAGLLSPELLQAVFDVAAIRLGRTSAGSSGPLGFKPQELCTLLRACHLGVAQPWAFLHSLSRVMAQYPAVTQGWTSAELGELHTALQLLRSAMPAMQHTQAQQQLQQQQQQAAAAAAAQQQAQMLAGLPAGAAAALAASLGMDPRPRQQILVGGGQALAGPYSGSAVVPSASTVSTLESSSAAMSSASPQPSAALHHNGGLAAPHYLGAPHGHHATVQQQQQLGAGLGMYHVPSSAATTTSALGLMPPHPQQQQQDGAQLSGVLQQVWVVDATGNLQKTTLLLPAGVSVHDSLQQLSLNGNGGGNSGSGSASPGLRAPLAGSGSSFNMGPLARSGGSMNLAPLLPDAGMPSVSVSPLLSAGGSMNLAPLLAGTGSNGAMAAPGAPLARSGGSANLAPLLVGTGSNGGGGGAVVGMSPGLAGGGGSMNLASLLGPGNNGGGTAAVNVALLARSGGSSNLALLLGNGSSNANGVNVGALNRGHPAAPQ